MYNLFFSAGVPLTYYQHHGTALNSVKKLNNQFLSIPFSTTERDVFRKNGFLAFLSLNQIFENEYTIISGDKLQVRSMNFDDISRVTENYTAPRQYVGFEKYNKLFALYEGNHYFIAFCDNDAGLYIVRSGWNSDLLPSCYYCEYGIRPVVSLKSDVKASVKDIVSAWNIEI